MQNSVLCFSNLFLLSKTVKLENISFGIQFAPDGVPHFTYCCFLIVFSSAMMDCSGWPLTLWKLQTPGGPCHLEKGPGFQPCKSFLGNHKNMPWKYFPTLQMQKLKQNLKYLI